MKSNFLKLNTLACAVMLSFVGCQKQDHAYQGFLTQGERIYIGKVQDIVVNPGENRVALSWSVADSRVKSVRIKYNDGLDSLTLSLQKSNSIDRMETVMENLDERTYSFEIYTLDDKGNTSVAEKVDGRSYGQSYRQTLNNRILNRVTVVDNQVTTTWFSGASTMTSTEITYTDDTSGFVETVVLLPTDSRMVLENVRLSAGIQYRSAHKPTPLAIDLFYTDYSSYSAF